MKYDKKIYLSIFWVLLGIGLAVFELTGKLADYWFGMGMGFLVIGCIQVYRHRKYRTDADYKEQVDVALQDERNRFLRGKAWSWAGYLFVIISAVVSIGLRIAGQEALADLAGMGMALMLFLYWACFMILRRKY